MAKSELVFGKLGKRELSVDILVSQTLTTGTNTITFNDNGHKKVLVVIGYSSNDSSIANNTTIDNKALTLTRKNIVNSYYNINSGLLYTDTDSPVEFDSVNTQHTLVVPLNGYTTGTCFIIGI